MVVMEEEPMLIEQTEPNPEDLQRKLYFLLDQLQMMALELPPTYQQRIPNELLTGLANCLLNETIFEIVKGLMEIQHMTEKQLFQHRLQIINRQNNLKKSKKELILRSKGIILFKVEIQEMLQQTIDAEERQRKKFILKARHREELRQTDMKLVLQLDQKVSDQQVTLEKAGVPGFYVTNNPLEVKVQMHLLDFILRISRMKIPP